MSLDDYLTTHFVEKARFAELAGISVQRLEQLLEADAIPRATYRSDGHSITSQAFGQINGCDALPGEYFRPECVRWAKIADEAPSGLEQCTVLETLTHELSSALSSYGYPPATVTTRIQGYIPHFLNGTFGLCVADPSTGAGIARKEVLQERLTEITTNGSNPTPEGMTRDELLLLIDEYATAAMPFSPAEYPRSSRKRLVDDLRLALATS